MFPLKGKNLYPSCKIYCGICDTMVYVTVVKTIPGKPNEILNQDGWKITTQGTIQSQPDIF